MKVLINCPSKFGLEAKTLKKIGGIESLNLDLANILSKKKIKIIISTNCNRTTLKNNIINLPVHLLKKNSKNYEFDYIISSNDSSIFSYFPNSKKILWLHNQLQIEKSLRKKQFFHIIKHKPLVVFVSSYLSSITSRLYPFRKRLIIPNFLSPIFTNKISTKKRKNIFVWSVQRDRGLTETIDMWVNKIYPFSYDAQFYILGINTLPKKFNMNFLKSKNIFFFGRVSKTKLKKIYTQSTAMICLGYDETFCLNALEANSCGLPVITFGKTALKELIKHNYNGFIVNDFNKLSKKIINLMQINSLNKKKFTFNSIMFSKKYYPNNIVYKWLKLLK